MPLISFILPVYNVEQYLNECVKSILAQESSDYEILLVDDGSTDKSSIICDNYAEEYDFIRVIHKENGGLSDARNKGIEETNGKYILFVDADDYIDPHFMKDLFNNTTDLDADVIFLEATKVFPDGSKQSLGNGYKQLSCKGKGKDAILKSLAMLPKYPGSACDKMIRRQLFLDNDLFFEKQLFSEDLDWMPKLLYSAETFDYCPAPYYYYRQRRPGSITNSRNAKKAYDILYIIEKWSRCDDEQSEWQKMVNSFMAYEFPFLLTGYINIPTKEKAQYRKRVKACSKVLKCRNTRRNTMIAISYHMLGITITGFVLRTYLTYR